MPANPWYHNYAHFAATINVLVAAYAAGTITLHAGQTSVLAAITLYNTP